MIKQPDFDIWYALTQIASLWTIGFNNFELLPAVTRQGMVGTLHIRLPAKWVGGRNG